MIENKRTVCEIPKINRSVMLGRFSVGLTTKTHNPFSIIWKNFDHSPAI